MSIESSLNANRTKEVTVPTLAEIDALILEHKIDAVAQLDLIAPTLRRLAKKIESEKPDTVVFLDKSARIFGTPYLKYLNETMGVTAPRIRFFNDHVLKAKRFHPDGFKVVAREMFGEIANKKVFFVDETYSNGKGAVSILQAAQEAEVDAYYFAFSKDPTPSEIFEVTARESKIIADAINSGHVYIGPTRIENLFSRWTSSLYIQDFQGQTVSAGKDVSDDVGEKGILNANTYIKVPDGFTKEEYLKEASKKMDTVVRDVKALIYEKLTEVEDDVQT